MALALAAATAPDLLIIDQKPLGGRVAPLIRALRARLGRSDLPVILLTDDVDGGVCAGNGLAAATDYLAKPITLPILRTRVHTWLVRGLAQAHRRTPWRVCLGRPAPGYATPSH